MTKIVNLNFQQLINGWQIEVVGGNKDDDFSSLSDILSNMSYEANKSFWEEYDQDNEDEIEQDDDFDIEEDLEVDEDVVEKIVKKFFDDESLEINIRCSQDDS